MLSLHDALPILRLVLPGTTTSGGGRMGAGSLPTLSAEDAAAIRQEVPGVFVAAPLVRGSGQVVFGNLNWFTVRSEEHTSELQSLMRISYAVFCLKKKNNKNSIINNTTTTHTQTHSRTNLYGKRHLRTRT